MNAAKNFAKTISRKHGLVIPFNLEELVREYGELYYLEFPDAETDGVTLDLKVAGERPKIFINSRRPERRQIFTLAHELGHIIIPWHIGSIVDNISHDIGEYGTKYYKMEQEADEFASELLLPEEWAANKLNDVHSIEDLANQIDDIYKTTNLSHAAIGYRCIDLLPPQFVFITTDNDEIIKWFKTSPSTLNALPYNAKGSYLLTMDFYQQNKDSYLMYEVNGFYYYWFYIHIDIELEYDESDSRSHKEILKQITDDLGVDAGLIRQLNPALGHTMTKLKQEGNMNLKNLYSHFIAKVQNDSKYNWITEHPDYKTFLYKRADAFVIKGSS